MNKIDTVYISNISEDVWPFISSISDPYKMNYEIEENAKLSDRDIFSFCDNKNIIFILPKLPDRSFINYYNELFGTKALILSPKIHTGEICKDIMRDPELMTILRKYLKSDNKVSFLSYAASTQFAELYQNLTDQGMNLALKESPDFPDLWTVDFFGSKSGIRQFSQISEKDEPDFAMSDGLVISGIENASKVAAKFYLRDKSVVIKTNKGHSGAGILIFRKGDLPFEYSDCVEKIYSIFQTERYWRLFPIIVEKYIEPTYNIGGGFPSIEYKISKNGKANFLYYCAMRVTTAGEFKGVEIHEDVLEDQDSSQIMDTGFYIAEKYSSYGYRGYFDVDFIVAKNGNIYVTESNVRRTGGTHVFCAARYLFGKDFTHDTYTLSNNLFQIRNHNLKDFTSLNEQLEPLMFDRTSGEGLIITSASLLSQNKFGYIIFGKNKHRAYEIEKKMEERLKNGSAL